MFFQVEMERAVILSLFLILYCYVTLFGLSIPHPPALISSPRPLAPGPPKIFNHLNFLLFKVQSLCSCAHYFQWFTDYVDFTHVICTCFKETVLLFNVHLSYFADFTLCPTGKFKINCLKLIIKKITVICWMRSKLKVNTAWHSWLINIVFLFLSLNKYLAVGCERQVIMKTQKAISFVLNKKSHFIQRFIVAPIRNKLWTYDHTMNI